MSEASRHYYTRSFPAPLVYAFAARREHREFAAVVVCEDGDRLWRHLSFSTLDEFRAFLQRQHVKRVEVGAFYSTSPSFERRYKVGALPLARELVYDVDADAYDAQRTCCRGARVCARCWPLLMYAARSLDHVLRAMLGFKHVLWVYSGRRGVHAWVCDERALTLSERARECAVSLLRSSSSPRLLALRRECERECKLSSEFRVHVDVEVSRQRSHLLKVPFSLHPETGHISLPVRLDEGYAPLTARDVASRRDTVETRRFDEAIAYFRSFVRALKP